MNNDYKILQEDVTRPFSPERFSISRRPVSVGRITHPIAKDGLPCCLDMLVKLPGGDLVVPEPYVSNPGIAEYLSACVEFEDRLLPAWRETHYAYLTVDYRYVAPRTTHRNRGWHIDGFQGARYPVKMNVCHEYIVSDRLPTEFTDAVTDASGLDELKHNWFVELGKQIPDDRQVLRPEPFEIVVMSAYQLHRSQEANETDAGWRGFLRLDISLKQQDRLGNTLNPLLPAPFEFVPRSLPEGLAVPVDDAGWDGARTFDGSRH